jgi:hypothetical protein
MIATLAAVLASIGDLSLLMVANGAAGVAGLSREGTLVAGFYLGVLAIPIYALGYRDASRSLPEPNARLVTALGACGAVVGAVIHGVTAVALHAHASPAGGSSDAFGDLAPVALYVLPLWTIAAIAVVGASVAFVLPVLRGESAHARWVAATNPAVMVVVIGALAALSSWSRAIVAPAAPNLAHVVFFAATSARRRSIRHRAGGGGEGVTRTTAL